MANTTRTQIPAEVNNFYDKALLMRAIPLYLHNRWGQVRDIPSKAGTKTIKFRRYSNLAAATTALTEGVTPAGSQLSVTDITATVAQYGDFVTVTDVVTWESPDAVLTEAAEILGDQAGLTLDTLTRDVLHGGTNVRYANAVANRASVAAAIALADVDSAVLTLKEGLAKRMTRMVSPDTGYATTPVRPTYIGIIHPRTTKVLQALTGWNSIEKYANKADLMEGEVGTYGDVRFVETTQGKVFTGAGSGAIDVYSTLIFGMEAYGVTRVSGEAMKNIVKPLGSGGTEDPLDQRATSGWKATHVAKILNDNFLIRIEHAV